MAIDTKFQYFNIIDNISYKIIGDTAIPVTVLVPKDVPSGSRPVIVRWHGGFWIAGERMYAPMFPQWIVSLAQKQGAILLSPDYRLLPEATGDELLSDLGSFMHWLPTKRLDEILKPHGVTADLGKVLTTGESAGGWCAVQTALLQGSGIAGFPSRDSPVKIKAAISHYGVLDLERPFFNDPTIPKTCFFSPPQPPDTLDQHMRAIKSGVVPQICTGVPPPGRLYISGCAFQQSRIPSLMGPGLEKYPMQVLEKINAVPPPVWALSGTDDTAVPWECSRDFVEKAKQIWGQKGWQGKLTLVPGEHGMDTQVGLKEEWVLDGVDWVEKFWLGEDAHSTSGGAASL